MYTYMFIHIYVHIYMYSICEEVRMHFASFRAVPESTRWLVENDRKERAMNGIRKASLVNKVVISEDVLIQVRE